MLEGRPGKEKGVVEGGSKRVRTKKKTPRPHKKRACDWSKIIMQHKGELVVKEIGAEQFPALKVLTNSAGRGEGKI